MSRQLDGERASFAGTIPSAKRPAVSLDGLPCNGQPQAKPAPIGSCLNERSEDLFDLLVGETTTRVIDIDGDSVALQNVFSMRSRVRLRPRSSSSDKGEAGKSPRVFRRLKASCAEASGFRSS